MLRLALFGLTILSLNSVSADFFSKEDVEMIKTVILQNRKNDSFERYSNATRDWVFAKDVATILYKERNAILSFQLDEQQQLITLDQSKATKKLGQAILLDQFELPVFHLNLIIVAENNGDLIFAIGSTKIASKFVKNERRKSGSALAIAKVPKRFRGIDNFQAGHFESKIYCYITQENKIAITLLSLGITENEHITFCARATLDPKIIHSSIEVLHALEVTIGAKNILVTLKHDSDPDKTFTLDVSSHTQKFFINDSYPMGTHFVSSRKL